MEDKMKRRDFLKSSMLGFAAIILPPSLVIPKEIITTPLDKGFNGVLVDGVVGIHMKNTLGFDFVIGNTCTREISYTIYQSTSISTCFEEELLFGIDQPIEAKFLTPEEISGKISSISGMFQLMDIQLHSDTQGKTALIWQSIGEVEMETCETRDFSSNCDRLIRWY